MTDKKFTLQEKAEWLSNHLGKKIEETELHGPGQFEAEVNQDFDALYKPEKPFEFTPFQFKKYSSIENTYRKKEIDRIVEQGNSSGLWRVSEKVHGANFSFWYDGKDMKCAKRTGFLGEGSNFFNWHDVRMDEQPKIEKLWEYLKGIHGEDLKEVVIYGEIFGGSYPHPDVERDHNAMTVQKGVFYSPSNLFYVFDIKVNGSFVNEHVKGDLCERFNFLWDEPLFEGTFAECLEYSNTFITTIPKKLGLPDIENNYCEGVVIKPVEVKRSWAGSRVLLKNKNDKFAEVTKKKSGKCKIKKPKEEIKLSPEAETLLETILTYVNENRLRAVLSKMEAITDKCFGKLVGNLSKDVIEDFLKDHKDAFMALPDKERKYITKIPGRIGAEMIRKDFLNIIDNTY